MASHPDRRSGNRYDFLVTITVLVVDDHLPFRDAARAVVDRLDGFRVVAEAASGDEAIQMVEAIAPQLVLMDINMPGVDGIEATTQITVEHPSTMVVLLSTYELSDLPATARTSGAAAYIHKDDFGGRVLQRLWDAGGDPDFRR